MANDATGTSRTPVRAPSPDDPTIGRLVADASRDISSLVSKEIALAKSELKVSVKAGGIGHRPARRRRVHRRPRRDHAVVHARLLHPLERRGLSLHWAYLIVTGFWFLLAALLGWIGVKKLKQVGPPEKAIEQGREIPKALCGARAVLARAALGRPLGSLVRPSSAASRTWSAVSA